MEKKQTQKILTFGPFNRFCIFMIQIFWALSIHWLYKWDQGNAFQDRNNIMSFKKESHEDNIGPHIVDIEIIWKIVFDAARNTKS